MVVYCSTSNPPPKEKKEPAAGTPFRAPAAPTVSREQAEGFGAGRVKDKDSPAVAGGGSYL